MKIILDAMGGDHAPQAPVLGAIQAAKDFGAQITLVGKGDQILEVMRANGIENLPEGMEIAIDSNQHVFAFIGTIQEETHRFAITYHRQLRSKRLRYSELDEIPGIGPKRKEQLLKQFKSLTAIGQAELQELERILPKDAAAAVYHHFHGESQ